MSIAMNKSGESAGAAAPHGRRASLPSSTTREAARCRHCGERCGREAKNAGGDCFCCSGCLAVFTLLTESGLGQFYELAPTPGTPVGERKPRQAWAFLDEPAVRQSLLDFEEKERASVRFHVPAIHCLACVWLLENLFRLASGVHESRADFLQREVRIWFEPARIKLSELAALLASLGYEPALAFEALDTLDRERRAKRPRRQQRQWLQLGLAGFGFGNIMLLALPGYLGLDSVNGPWFKMLAGWLSLALAAPVLVYSAADYWRAAWASFRQRVLTLDVPIAVGLAAIYGQSLFDVATGRSEGYADSLTGLIFFLLCGRWFQRKTFDRLAFDRDYKGFFPLAVIRRTASGDEPVAISQLAVGDRLRIRHGELVPADARLVSGEACVDYSFVTGESQPVQRTPGELLHAGGRQVGATVEVETVKPVSESYLTSLWNHDAFRKRRDDGLHSLTNRYSRRFTVIVLALAMVSAFCWMFFDPGIAVKAFISVLIVACPCALALAAPLTLGTAQRRLAGQNVFLRNAEVIEPMSAVDVVVFDKTGTLTTPRGDASWSGLPLTESETAWLHSTTRHSVHPLATRVAEATRHGAILPAESFQEILGQGVEARVGGHEIRLGSAEWLKASGVSEKGSAWSKRLGKAESAGQSANWADEGSAVHVAIDAKYRGSFRVKSALRPEMHGLVRWLDRNYELVLLSGDNARETDQFRALFGARARLEFAQSPFDKLNVIRELQASGRTVMMVGDGLNDAGALRQADVGVAVVEQVGNFSPASDVILDAARLSRLGEALTMARQATRVVRAGFVISGLYNVVGLSIAAAGLLSPLVCAVLMPVSSATVVLFAVGMTRWVARQSFPNAGPKTNASFRPNRQPVAGGESAATEGMVLP